ncbi:hypothetical protein, partial [Lentibacter algarum]|uniref:hypothetical protein n=1 Tax=Lentibacter algarum TaxID=576131 RepID=UPI0026EE648F
MSMFASHWVSAHSMERNEGGCIDLGQEGEFAEHRARTEGQEAKRPPRGGGSGAAKSEIWQK